jgi:hypothetical protein
MTARSTRSRTRQLGLVLAGSLLLAGCASSQASAPSKTLRPGAAMTPGMVMPDGSTMGAAAAPGPSTAAAQPSASAAMVCSADVRNDIKTVLASPRVPAGTSTFVDHLFTCSYRLPIGTLVLLVQESPDAAATSTYFASLRQQLGKTADLAGLGEGAYGTDTGTVVVRKDDHVLRVDATDLPGEFGAQRAKRADFAYEIASVILGCWTGDDD